MDVALFFRFGRAVISDLGMLNGVNNFIVLMGISDILILRSPKNLMHGWNYPKNIRIALQHHMCSSSSFHLKAKLKYLLSPSTLWNYSLHSAFLSLIWQLCRNGKIKLHPKSPIKTTNNVYGIYVLLTCLQAWSEMVGLGK